MRITPSQILAIGSALMIDAGLAQPDTMHADEVDQIIVTGARTPVTIDQLGSATTIITRDQIERRQARYVVDLLRSVPGFSISHTGVIGSQAQVRVRGSEANHVLVLIDGVRANDPATGDEFRWEYLSSANIERIEIVRGAQSSLWGSDALSAVVHIITRKGDGVSSLDGFAESGSDRTRNFGVNGSVGDSAWSLGGGVEYLETSGDNIAREGSERDGSDLLTASLSARLRRSDTFSLDADLRIVDATSQYDPVDFIVTGLPVDGDVTTESEHVTARAGAAWTRPDGRWSHRAGAAYYDSEHDNLTDRIATSSAGADRTALSWQSDLSLGQNVLSIALEHEQMTYRQRGEIVFGDPNQDQRMDVTSAIAEFQWLSRDRLTGLVSARFDHNSDFEDIVTGRMSLAVPLRQVARFRTSVSRGQKNPTFTERFGFFAGQFIGNPSLSPERSTAFDVGIDFDLLDGALALQASLFHQDLRDEINGFVFDSTTFLATAENRRGRSERSGAELAAQWDVGSRFELGASYTYIDSSEQDDFGNEAIELRRPRNAGSLSLGYRALNRLTQVVLAADYGGARKDTFFPPFPAPSEIVTLQDYWLIDLAVQFELTSRITLFVRGTNLLDEEYEQVFGYRTPGRMGYVGIRTKLRR